MFSLRGVWSRCVMLMVINWYHYSQIWVCGCIIEIYVVATVQGNARHRKIYEKHLHIWAVWITQKKKTTHIYMILYDIYMSRLNHSKKKTTHNWYTVEKHVYAANISFAVTFSGLWSGCRCQVSAKCLVFFFIYFSSSFSCFFFRTHLTLVGLLISGNWES